MFARVPGSPGADLALAQECGEALFLHFPLALLAAVTVASVDDAVFHARILRKTKALSAE